MAAPSGMDFTLANAHMRKNDPRKAIPLYLRATELKGPYGSGSYVGLGDAYLALNDDQESIFYYRQALKIDPRVLEDIKQQLAQRPEILQRVLGRMSPEKDDSRSEALQRAVRLIRSGQYKEAIAVYVELKATGKINRGVYVNLGNLYAMSGAPDDAIQTYNEGLREFPDDEMLMYNLADALINSGELASARDILEELVADEKSRNHAMFQQRLEAVLKRLSR